MSLRVLRGRVVVRMDGRPSTLITIVDNSPRATESHRGTVLEIGAGAFTRKGVEVSLPIEVGDRVGFHFEATEAGRTASWTDGKPAIWLAQRELDYVIEE